MSWRSVYTACICIEQIMLVAAAMLTPILATPGYYWWSAFCLICYFMSGKACGERFDKWDARK